MIAHVLVVGDVILAIGQLQAALQQVRGIVIGIVKARSHPQSEEVRGVEVGVVQRVDIGAQSFSQTQWPAAVLLLMAAMAFRCGSRGARPLASMPASSM